jgi:hypothetical protein
MRKLEIIEHISLAGDAVRPYDPTPSSTSAPDGFDVSSDGHVRERRRPHVKDDSDPARAVASCG